MWRDDVPPVFKDGDLVLMSYSRDNRKIMSI